MDMKSAITHKTETKVPERTLFDTIGDELQRVRVSKNLSIETIAETLNIREKYLEALEKNETGVFPAAVYGVAFLRSYAAYLGLDSDQLVKKYQSQNKTPAQTQADFPIKSESSVLPDKSILMGAGALLVLLAGGVFALIHFNDVVSKNEANAPASLETAVVEASVQDETLAPAVAENAEEAPTDETMPEPIETAAEAAVQESDDAPVQEEPKATDEKAESVYSDITGKRFGDEKNARVVLVAKESVWINVSESGNSVFDKVLNAGEAYFVPADRSKLVLRTGNAKGLIVYVDKTAQGTLSRREKIMKNVSLNPDAIRRK